MDVYRHFHSLSSIFSLRFYTFCPKLLRGCPVFPAPSRQPDKIGRVEQNLDRRGAGRRQTDLKKRHSGHAAHEPGHRDPHTEGSHDPLDHNEKGLTASIEISHKAEQERRKDTVDGVMPLDNRQPQPPPAGPWQRSPPWHLREKTKNKRGSPRP